MIDLHALDTLVANHLAFDVACARTYHNLGSDSSKLDSFVSKLNDPDALVDLPHVDLAPDVDTHAVLACAAVRRLRSLVLEGHTHQVLQILNSNITPLDPGTELNLRIHSLAELLFSANDSKQQFSDALVYSQQLATFALHAFPEAYDSFKLAMMLFVVPNPSPFQLQRRRHFISAHVLALVRHFAAEANFCSQLSLLVRYLGIICCSKRPHLVDLNDLLSLRNHDNLPQEQSPIRRACKFDSPFLSFSSTSNTSIISLNEADVQALAERTGLPRDDAVNLLKLANGNPERAIQNYLACVLLKPHALRQLVIDYCAARGLYDLFDEIDDTAVTKNDKDKDKQTENAEAEISTNDDLESSPTPTASGSTSASHTAVADELFKKVFGEPSCSNDFQFEDVPDDHFFPTLSSLTDSRAVVSIPASCISLSSRMVGRIMNDVRKALDLHNSDEFQASRMLRDAAMRACSSSNSSSSSSSISRTQSGDSNVERHLWFRLNQRDVLYAFQSDGFADALSTIVKHLTPAAASDSLLRMQLHDTIMVVACGSHSGKEDGDDNANDKMDYGDDDCHISEKRRMCDDKRNGESSTETVGLQCDDTGSTAPPSKSDCGAPIAEKNPELKDGKQEESDFEMKLSEAREAVYEFCSPYAIAHNIYQTLVGRYGQPGLVTLLDGLIKAHTSWQADGQMKDRFAKRFGVDMLCGHGDSEIVGGSGFGKGMRWMMDGVQGEGRRGRRGRNGCQKRRRLRSGSKQKQFVSGDNDEDMEEGEEDANMNNSAASDVDSGMEQTVLTLMEFLAMSRAEAVAVVRNHPRAADAQVILDSLLGAS